uniref:Serum amyloid A protein n=1 Tax=Mesocricetus auratus TaxID=10036 RepID=Q64423_MESAU|nr:serum amyloid A [Mesocricetus auratus]
MKPFLAIIFCFLILGVDSQRWFQFMKEAGQGSRDMWRAYSDMREANWKNSDKYFHARGNYDAAKRGPGGAWAAKVISSLLLGYSRGHLWGRNPEGGTTAFRVVMALLLVCLEYSDAREGIQRFTGRGAADSRADQFANKWGRSGKDPHHFRPAGLPSKY